VTLDREAIGVDAAVAIRCERPEAMSYNQICRPERPTTSVPAASSAAPVKCGSLMS